MLVKWNRLPKGAKVLFSSLSATERPKAHQQYLANIRLPDNKSVDVGWEYGQYVATLFKPPFLTLDSFRSRSVKEIEDKVCTWANKLCSEQEQSAAAPAK